MKGKGVGGARSQRRIREEMTGTAPKGRISTPHRLAEGKGKMNGTTCRQRTASEACFA